jgi:hypothetical protein
MSSGEFTRRGFVAHAAAAGVLVAVAPALSVAGSAAASDAVSQVSCGAAEPVVSFHLDQPYLDMTGQGIPYQPPSGARSGQALADLTEAEFYCCGYGV